MTLLSKNIRVHEIVGPVKGKLVSGSSDRVVKGISTDSRNICAEELFIALKGENFDGHHYLSRVSDCGASCVIIERGSPVEGIKGDTAVIEVSNTLNALGDLAMWWRKQFDVTVISITGSMGKTTTKEMIASIMELEGVTLKSEGNFNNLIGLPLTLFQLNERHKFAVLEMGMNRPGEIGRLTRISDPDAGLITNVGRVHLEGVGSLKGVAEAKTEMLEAIRPEAAVILNGDDKILMEAAGRFDRQTYTFGTGPENKIRIKGVKDLEIEGSEFDVIHEKNIFSARIHIPGFHNVLNAAAAISAAICMGAASNNIVKGLERYSGTRGRLTPVKLPDNVILLDDSYNSNPSSLRAVLQTAKIMAGNSRRIIVALGEMLELGEETIKAHVEAGEMVAETGAGFFLAMGDHASNMIDGAVNKGFPFNSTVKAESHSDMTKRIRDVMQKNDLILVKGSRRIGLDRVVSALVRE